MAILYEGTHSISSGDNELLKVFNFCGKQKTTFQLHEAKGGYQLFKEVTMHKHS